MDLPSSVTIVEVGPRDGIQYGVGHIPTAQKIELIDRLSRTGLRVLEVTSFVSPRWVPQFADAEEVLAGIALRPDVRFSALVPNERGLERAIGRGITDVAIFASASEEFSRRNLNRSVAESIEMFRPVVSRAVAEGLRVRGYVSMVCGCPFQGDVPIEAVVRLAAELMELGCDEISLGDTVGVGTAGQVQAVVAAVSRRVPIERLAVHLHDTYGQGLANTLAALEAGVTIADTSVGGLGGCPYAPGARGNLATEDLVYALRGSGVEVGVDLEALVDVSAWISNELGIPPSSRVVEAMLAKREGSDPRGG
jgi:hydroxymethylglutaryl-CoA lyase